MAAFDFWSDPTRAQQSATATGAPATTTRTSNANAINIPADTPVRSQNPIDYLRDVFEGRNRDPLMGDIFIDWSKMGEQFDPKFLDTIRRWLESLGVQLQYKPSDQGLPSGRIRLPNGEYVDLNVGGKWGWLLRGLLSGHGDGTELGSPFGIPFGFGAGPLTSGIGLGGHIEDNLLGNRVFNDPATMEWETLLRQYVTRLQRPYSDTDQAATEDYLRRYFQRLQGPAYTPQEMDLLNTQAVDPLTADRDANRQKVLLWASSHGMTPESGPVQQLLADADRQYEALRTRARADIATRAIDLGRENEARATQVGSMLAAIKQHMFDLNEGRFGQSVSTFKQIPELADTRLQLAMAALGMGGGGAVNGLSNALNLLGSFQNSKSGGGNQSNLSFWADLLKSGLSAIPFFA